MGIILRVLIGLAVVAGIIFAIGLGLPKTHRAESRITLEKSPAEVWEIVRNPAALVGTWTELTESRRVEDPRGREVWAQKAGGFDMRLVIETSSPPSRLVTRIDADEKATFGGTWTYTLTPAGSGTTLTIVEDGFVNNPFFRTLMTVMGKHRTIDGYLKALGDKVDEPVRPEHVK